MNPSASPQRREVFVSWRDPSTRSIHPVGRLRREITADGDEIYTFAYIKNAERLPGFEPLPGLAHLYARYESRILFPVFANRVMPRRRPEFDLFARQMDLAGVVDPFEVLARSGGRRETDRIEVFSPPERTPDGRATGLFFVRGIRHVPGAAAAVGELRPGDRLTLAAESDNQTNPLAMLVLASPERRVGYMPDYLLGFVHDLNDLNAQAPDITVEHVNDENVPAHLRLLCRLSAPWPPGYEAFAEAMYQSLAG
jgi:hypothetical protein